MTTGLTLTNEQDTLQTTVDSSALGEGPSTEPQAFTKEEKDKAVNDALAAAGRTAKTLETDKQSLKADKDALATERSAWQKEREEAEEYALREDPDGLAAMRTERRKKAEESTKATELTEREAKLRKDEEDHAEIMERDKKVKRTELASEVATEKGVSVDSILKLAKEDTRKAYEEVAELLPKSQELPVLVTHSGRTNRGSQGLGDMAPEEQLTALEAKLR